MFYLVLISAFVDEARKFKPIFLLCTCIIFYGVFLYFFRKIAGLTDKRATEIISYREKNGPFINRKQLIEVKGIGARIFEQCAGFLRVGPVNEDQAAEFYRTSDSNKLDRTYIHPESYEVTAKLLDKCALKVEEVGTQNCMERMSKATSTLDMQKLSVELNSTEQTLQLIVESLCKPLSHDLRTMETHAPLFRKGLTDINELRVGTVLTGRISNVTHFGCFVDIGVGCNGLIHTSRMNRLNLQIGDRVEVKVVNIEIDRKRIGLEALRKL